MTGYVATLSFYAGLIWGSVVLYRLAQVNLTLGEVVAEIVSRLPAE